MTIRFEIGALTAVAGLVAGLVAMVVLNPLEKSTAAPKASLWLPAPVAPAPVAAKVTPKMKKSAVAGVDTLTGVISVRAPNRHHTIRSENTAQALSETFGRLGYDLERVSTGEADVPRLFLASLPSDLKNIREAQVRKALFFKSVLPLVLQVNEEILRDRRRLWKLRYQLGLDRQLGPVDRLWLIVMAERYGVRRGNLDALLKRVDIIPPSMALAQAAEESGWGTSRFVREGNAVFGQWTFSGTGNLVPARRDEEKLHKVKAFSSLLDSVRAYARNLNTHRAYRMMRRDRYDLRLSGAPLDGLLLAGRLKSYSQRGQHYVEAIRTIIKTNKLRRLDDARLSGKTATPRPLI